MTGLSSIVSGIDNFLFLPVHCFRIKHQGWGVHQHATSSEKHVLPRVHTWARGSKWTIRTKWTGRFHQIFFCRNFSVVLSFRGVIILLYLCNVVATIKHQAIQRTYTRLPLYSYVSLLHCPINSNYVGRKNGNGYQDFTIFIISRKSKQGPWQPAMLNITWLIFLSNDIA